MKETLKNRRKGTTIAEICVVLAVITIVSSIVLSFCLMVHHRMLASTRRLQIINEVEAVETMVEAWCDEVLSRGETINAPDNSLLAGSSTISFKDSIFNVLLDGETTTLECETISSVVFDLQGAVEDQILFCAVECTFLHSNGSSETETYVF